MNQTETIKPPQITRARALQPAKKQGILWRLRHSSPLALIFAAAVIIFYGTVFIYPFGTAIWLSFHNWDFLTDAVFVGTRNFSKALSDQYFWQALKTTILFSAVEITVAVALAMLLALAYSHVRGKLQNFFLIIYYLPVVTPTVASVFLWRWLYRSTGGTLNAVLGSIGIPQQPFLGSANQALWCITVMVIWANVGGAAVLFLAGINDVPESLYEAARLDGAGFWQTFFKITLPMIRPVLIYQVVVSVIGTVQMFEPFFLMSGPGFSTRTLSLYTYQLGFQTLNLGYGAAVSLIIFVLLLFATVFQLQRWQVNWEH
ncbi:MAG: sugar ABC transporter permease [Chloroflexi bacterium]|nr:sugar ABC transporter permease [Chloroflexota bacterium]